MKPLPRVALVLEREWCESRLKWLPFGLMKASDRAGVGGGAHGCVVGGRVIGMPMFSFDAFTIG